MKKLLALVSLFAFLAVSTNAQTTQSGSTETTKEAPAVKAEKKSGAGCCMKANTSCCKSGKSAKACTPEQKAACAKAGSSDKDGHAKAGCTHNHSKSEADSKETKESKAGSN